MCTTIGIFHECILKSIVAFVLDESNWEMQNLAFAQLLSTICHRLTTQIHHLLQ
jgi:hypothetical protein